MGGDIPPDSLIAQARVIANSPPPRRPMTPEDEAALEEQLAPIAQRLVDAAKAVGTPLVNISPPPPEFKGIEIESLPPPTLEFGGIAAEVAREVARLLADDPPPDDRPKLQPGRPRKPRVTWNEARELQDRIDGRRDTLRAIARDLRISKDAVQSAAKLRRETGWDLTKSDPGLSGHFAATSRPPGPIWPPTLARARQLLTGR